MFDYAAVMAVLKVIENSTKIGDNLTDSEQQEARLAIKAAKRAIRKEKVARMIFDGHGKFNGTDRLYPRENDGSKLYWKLRDRFNRV